MFRIRQAEADDTLSLCSKNIGSVSNVYADTSFSPRTQLSDISDNISGYLHCQRISLKEYALLDAEN
jgi:hypothetical protein